MSIAFLIGTRTDRVGISLERLRGCAQDGTVSQIETTDFAGKMKTEEHTVADNMRVPIDTKDFMAGTFDDPPAPLKRNGYSGYPYGR